VPYQRLGTRVPIEPFRERYLKMLANGEITAHGLAEFLDWTRKPRPSTRTRKERIPDVDRVNRMFGLRPTSNGGGRGKTVRQSVNHETAVRLAEILGFDPFEVGL
jgi:hypothetical protein